MTISLSDVLNAGNNSTFTPAKRDTPWSVGGSRTAQTTNQPIRLPEGSLLPTDPEIRSGLTEIADKYKINPALLMAMGHQESTYNPQAVGPETKWGTAKGMFQFLDSTASGHGIDAMDWRQAGEAAAKDLAEQIARNGVDWAVAHHHGGPDTRLHGPKTAQYTREVLAKAQAIATELGIPLDLPEGTLENLSTGGSDGKGTISLSEVLAAQPQMGESNIDAQPTDELSNEESLGTTIANSGMLSSPMEWGTRALGRTIERGWEGFQNMLNRETEEVTLTDEELRREWETSGKSRSRAVTEYGLTFRDWAEQNRTRTVSKTTLAEEEAAWAQRLTENPEDAHLLPKRLAHLRPQADDSRFAPKDTIKGVVQRFVANAKNPMDLMLQDSIPANMVTALFTLPEVERKKFDIARQRAQALEAINDPTGKSQEELELAQQTVDDWRKETNSTVIDVMKEMWQAFKEDPSAVGIGLYEGLFADPYLAIAPAGVGIKPFQVARAGRGVRAGLGAAKVTGNRASRIADAILDGSITAGSINVAAGAAQNLAEFGEVKDNEVKLNAAMGVILGGGLAPLFMKSARARKEGLDAAKLNGTLDENIRAMAEADVELEAAAREATRPVTDDEFRTVESALNKQESLARERRNKLIRDLLGVKDEADLARWQKERRAQVKEWFGENAEYADYQREMAEARIAHAARLADEAEARQRSAADSAYGVPPEDPAAKRQRLQKEYDAAIEARNAARETDLAEAAKAEDVAWEAAQRLNAEELFYAQLSQDHPTIRQVEAKIARRNDQLGRHRRKPGELGSADPETLARLGVVGTGAAAGYALFPEDEKLAGGLLGGLAGLLAPAGGSVLSRMRQAGSVDPSGNFIGAAVSKGFKLADKLEEADILARDNAWIDATRAGDQQAFKAIYDTYAKSIERYVNNRLPVDDAAGVAQEALLDLYKKITSDPEFTVNKPLGAWLRDIAYKRATDDVRRATATKRKADVVSDNLGDNFDDDVRGDYSLLDETEGGGIIQLPDSPESLLIGNEVLDIIRQSLDGMPEKHQQLFAMTQLDHFDLQEAAKQLGLSYANARQIVSRVETRVREAITANRRNLGQEPSPADLRIARGQRGSASVEALQRTAAITALATAGGTAGYFMSDGDLWKTGLSALVTPPAVALLKGTMRGSGNIVKGDLRGTSRIAAAIRGVDYRLKDINERLWGLAKEHGANELREIRKYNDATAKFTEIFHHLPADIKPIIIRALSTRDKTIINKMLDQVGGEEFVKAFDTVRKKLDEVEDRLVDLGLISKSEKDYFPFRVKDLEGLKKALGQQASTEIDAAIAAGNKKMQKREGRDMTEIERSIVLNKVLEPYLGKSISANTPGFAKARTIKVIDENLQQFYYDPIATLNSYGVQAIKYIERAKFFGKHLKKTKNDQGKLAVNISDSIGALVDDMRNKGDLTEDKAAQLAGMLQDRFNGGEMGASVEVQGIKDITNGSLLGNIYSAATQLGDIALQAQQQGLIPTVKTLRRMLMRDKIIDMKNFGLDDHIAHEFLSDNWTRKYAKGSLKWSGFQAIDRLGKNFGLGAAVERMMRDARTPQGTLKLADRFQRSFPDLYKEALPALRRGEVNEAVEVLAFSELTKTQPLTAWELPQFYHRMPNGRIVYQMQTFNLRVINLVYEDALRKIASGKAKDMAKGTKSLLGLSVVLGLQGVATDKIKDIMAGKEVELSPEEIPINTVEALGMSTYDYNRIADSGPAGLLEGRVPGIVRMSTGVWTEPERSMQFIPVVGKPVYNWSNIMLSDNPDAARADKRKGYWEERRRKRRREQGYKMEITVPPSSGGGGRGSRGSRGGR